MAQSPAPVYALYKPRGLKCDLSVSAPPNPHRPKDLQTWFNSLCPNLRHIGRLDKATTGLLLATTATTAGGQLTARLLTPGHVSKTYVATCRLQTKRITVAQQEALVRDVELNDGPASFDTVHVLGYTTTTFGVHERYEMNVQVTIRMGRNRIVRRLLAQHHMPVRQLKRTAIGGLRLVDVPLLSTNDSCRLTATQIELLWLDAKTVVKGDGEGGGEGDGKGDGKGGGEGRVEEEGVGDTTVGGERDKNNSGHKRSLEGTANDTGAKTTRLKK
jgi:pseudouridine synthase